MMNRHQDSFNSLDLPGNPLIVPIPCLAHVIQLSLRALLGFVKADPQNNTTDRAWSEVQAQSLRTTKIRGLAVFINASPQRRDAILGLQDIEPKLDPIQDV
ncbi:HAT dimerization [Penicillium maclennaniae]|uniref:HAT dimerization n=1 Tax=Penicillium maclennaniae TaxID=1343394 RepID=UPI0025422467|nr:HAT dimerization [Penicillium maclennaniae]KAJ5683809.1 HAT dimerization [Penicillium maclennaniae]